MLYQTEKEDLASLAIIMKEAYRTEPWKEDWNKEECLIRLTDIFSMPSSFCFTLKEEEKILGGILGYVLPYEKKKELTLVECFLSPTIKKKGYGSLMLKEAEEKARKEGITHIVLNTRYPLDSFYQKNGYHVDEEGRIMEKDI